MEVKLRASGDVSIEILVTPLRSMYVEGTGRHQDTAAYKVRTEKVRCQFWRHRGRVVFTEVEQCRGGFSTTKSLTASAQAPAVLYTWLTTSRLISSTRSSM